MKVELSPLQAAYLRTEREVYQSALEQADELESQANRIRAAASRNLRVALDRVLDDGGHETRPVRFGALRFDDEADPPTLSWGEPEPPPPPAPEPVQEEAKEPAPAAS